MESESKKKPQSIYSALLTGPRRGEFINFVWIVYGACVIVLGIYYIFRQYFNISYNVKIGVMFLLFGTFIMFVLPKLMQFFPFSGSKVSSEILNDVDAVKNISSKTKKRNESGSETERIEFVESASVFNLFRNRMVREIFRLQSTANKNLIIGVVFCALGACVLIYMTITQNSFPQLSGKASSHDVGAVLIFMIPRLTVGFLVSAVGFFFLRLYMSNEFDIKHTKNEITNIEVKMMSLSAYDEYIHLEKVSESSMKIIGGIVKDMSSTERNFLVKNGLKTVNVEMADDVSKSLDVMRDLISALSSRATAEKLGEKD